MKSNSLGVKNLWNRYGNWSATLAVFLALRVGTATTAGVTYVLLCVACLVGEKWILRALAMSWLMTMFNPALGPSPTFGASGRFLLIGVAMFSCLLRWKWSAARITRPVWWVVVLGAFFVLHSILLSAVPLVSTLKAVSWTMAAVTCTSAWGRLSSVERQDSLNELYRFLCMVLFFSAPFIALPAGYFRNGSGFQGILNHPQVLGPTMALLSSWTLAKVLQNSKPSWRVLAIFGLSSAAVLASEARTAGFSVIIGVGCAALFTVFSLKNRIVRPLPGLRSRRLYWVLLAAITVGLMQRQWIARGVDEFVSKNREASTIFEAYESSRGKLMDSMIAGFLEKPLTGHGFGLPTSFRTMTVEYDQATGLPSSAAVEKGVLPLAILEDVGIFGFIAVMLWFWGGVRRAAREGVESLALVLTIWATNLGEATLLSPGGMGLLLLVTLTSATAFPLKKLTGGS